MNIIFIDVDGPLIPGRIYILDYMYDDGIRRMEEIGCKLLREIMNRCNAKLVACTTHSRDENRFFKMFEHEGFSRDDFHQDWRTDYPLKNRDRKQAVYDWLDNHKNVEKYIIIDDHKFNDPNYIDINPEIGITLDNYRKATELLGNKDEFIVLI